MGLGVAMGLCACTSYILVVIAAVILRGPGGLTRAPCVELACDLDQPGSFANASLTFLLFWHARIPGPVAASKSFILGCAAASNFFLASG